MKEKLFFGEKKHAIRAAGLQTEKKFFGPRGVFAKAGHTKHLRRGRPSKFEEDILDSQTVQHLGMQKRHNQPPMTWSGLVTYLKQEGFEPLGKKNVNAFSRRVGSLFQIIQLEARSWRVLYRTFLTAAASPALSLGTYTHLDQAIIAANRQANDWIGKKNPITVVGNPRKHPAAGKYRSGKSAYDIAVSYGFPYIRGDGRKRGGVWFNRFTRTDDERGPALWVGWNEKTRRWIIEGDEPLHKGIPGVGQTPRENPPKRIRADVAGVMYNRVWEVQAEKTGDHEHKGLWYHPYKGKSQVQMLALDSGDILLHSKAGKKLWKED